MSGFTGLFFFFYLFNLLQISNLCFDFSEKSKKSNHCDFAQPIVLV